MLWSKDELILALNLYLKLPFGKLHSKTPKVIHLARITDRTPSSIAMRLNNFAAVDPFHQNRGIVGLTGGKRQVQPIWDEFINNKEELIFRSERILAKKESTTLKSKYPDVLDKLNGLHGENRMRKVKIRVNQNVFRQIVLANYSSRCAISGINIPDLLVASHIMPWSKYENERLNPENGICLSPLYDKAFDRGYISIKPSLEIVLSNELEKRKKEEAIKTNFLDLKGYKLRLPKKYEPRKDFPQFHLDTIFKG